MSKPPITGDSLINPEQIRSDTKQRPNREIINLLSVKVNRLIIHTLIVLNLSFNYTAFKTVNFLGK